MTVNILPSEMIEAILGRLPAKSLCRFKSVSKQWCWLISDPLFIKNQLRLNNHHIPTKLILHSYAGRLYSIDINKISNDRAVTAEELIIWRPLSSWGEMLGSCDGLVLAIDKVDYVYLINPTIREVSKVPFVPLGHWYDGEDMLGFGYDSSIDSYKIILISLRWREKDSDFTKMMVLPNPPYKILSSSPFMGIFMNGNIHWLIKTPLIWLIIAFSLANEGFTEIKFPNLFDYEIDGCKKLFVIGGKLGFRTKSNDLWVMEEYGVGESWTKIHIHGVEATVICSVDDSIQDIVLGEEDEVDSSNFHRDLVFAKFSTSPTIPYLLPPYSCLINQPSPPPPPTTTTTAPPTMDDYPMLTKLESACSDLKTLLKSSANLQTDLEKLDDNFDNLQETLTAASRRLAPLQSLSIASKALETRINRAVSPALVLIDGFRISESLQRKLVDISTKLSVQKSQNKRLRLLIKYVDCVDKLNIAITLLSQEGGPAIQRLQEVVEFLSRTKATDQFRTHRLRETLVALNALYETEVDSMKFDGLLDEALLNLQDEFEGILLQLRHHDIGGGDDGGEAAAATELGTEMEVEVLRRISETLTANDCLDICIDIFVKVRYKRAAKALMRLNPDYLRTYKPEEIDEMEWESLETSITLWIQHFELAIRTVFVSEKTLCHQVLGNIMDGAIWQECFVKIADKIMAVFFRFGEGVARSNKEPQKLFKLLDMFDSLEKLKTEFSDVFEGEPGVDICSRFRELEKLLVHASSKVYWEFGLQIEDNQDGLPPPQDGSVPKLVRYAINYLKYLTTVNYSQPMARVLRTEQIWKGGTANGVPDTDDGLLKDAISNVMEALHRNIETKRSGYKDKVVYHVFTMNTYWYIYMRTRNTELGKLLGENYMRKNYKVVAEEAAYLYEKQAWGGLVRLLDKEDIGDEAIESIVKDKIEAFLKGFEEIAQRHTSRYNIPEADLRAQIKEATVKLIVPVYSDFLEAFSGVINVKSYSSPQSIEGLLTQIFSGHGRSSSMSARRREINQLEGGRNSVSSEIDSIPGRRSVDRFQRNRSNDGNV
ncbi:hypothetical protein LXL04_031773 [Taraxacum kok-saghyz]